MKKSLLFLVLASVVASIASGAGPRPKSPPNPTVSSTAQWEKVDDAVNEGLPQTAIELLEPIIQRALKEKNHPEAIRAIANKVALQGTIEGNHAEEKIVRFQAEIARAPQEMKPVMEAILANWYWHYFQQNRWRFLQRTQTESSPGPDIQTWDLARILAEIDAHYAAALADERALKAIPIATFDGLLEAGTVPDRYRPTLYDFLAYEALEFYQSGEHGGVHAEDAFELDAAASPIFDTQEAFMAWRPTAAADDRSPILRAIRLYQELLAFHRDDSDRSAFLDADLARLTYGLNVAVGEDKEELYRNALRRFIESAAAHETSAHARALLAARVWQGDDPAAARALAQRGRDAFPGSAGGAMCFNLIQEIESRELAIETEQVWNAPWPTLDVTYRNLSGVHFRAVPLDFLEEARRSRWSFSRMDEEVRRRVMAAKPALTWRADLTPTTDYKERTERVAVPETLKPGFYFILASHDPDFGEHDNRVSIASVWVSDLALITQMRTDGRTHRGFLLRAADGEPIAGATVRLWQRDREGRFAELPAARTDDDGRFTWNATGEALLLAEHDGHAVASGQGIYAYTGGEPDGKDSRTVFFTDRAIYRPGQTVHYKGVSIRYDPQGARYAAFPNLPLTVVFNDPNGKEIARTTHRTNDYGSFSGTFTAPRDRLTGPMSIEILGRPSRTVIRVEEYKRPKFEVELAAPTEAARLGERVRMTGTARAYTGASVDGAKVRWRVQRSVALPRWCWWFEPPAVQAIAHGTAATAADGTFSVEFTARPDRSVPERNEPVFTYSVHADVTDGAGETRSSERPVRVGYAALQAGLTAGEWLTATEDVVLRTSVRSLDGEGRSASGTVKIWSLKEPAQVERGPAQPMHHRRYRGALPVAQGRDAGDPETWETDRVLEERAFSTSAAGEAEIAVRLPVGIYRAVLESTDPFGAVLTARHTIQVVDPDAARLGLKVPQVVLAPQWSVEPGSEFTALWGTGYESGRAYVELESGGRVLKSYWTATGRTQERFTLPVDETMRGGVTLRVTSVRENRAHFVDRVIDVPWTNKQLNVTWESFRTRLTPGQTETWTAVVSGAGALRASAEMVAAMYDASLEQFAVHTWPQRFGVFREEGGRTQSRFHNAGTSFDFLLGQWASSHEPVDRSHRKFVDQITETLWGYQFRSRRAMRPNPAVTLGSGSGLLQAVDLADASLEARGAGMVAEGAVAASAPSNAAFSAGDFKAKDDSSGGADGDTSSSSDAPPVDLSQVAARTNLNETAFFFPHLTAGADGTVRMTFTMPEALTEWRFLGFAHDAQLRAGFLGGTAVTAKDIMVQPNPPRFVREGDVIEFTVKVTNLTESTQSGRVRLTFADAATLASVDAALGNATTEQAFEVPAKQSRSYSWRIAVPDGMGFLTYKAVGASAQASDGEEGFLPVLSRRILVTESLPLPVRGKTTKQFEFAKLIESGRSDTLRHQSLTVQMVSQPAWYAVMALPYLMEYPYECSEQIFNRYYANALARHIAGSDPKIRRVFDLWKNTPALDSPLARNQDLKSVLLEETPWLREAADESQARRDVGLLFDANRLDEEAARSLRKLAEQQLEDGLWPWFAGGRPSEFISLYIATGFGRLRHLGADVDVAPAIRALAALDDWMARRYRDIKPADRDDYVPGHLDAIYLYGRSFFLGDRAIESEHTEAVEFFQRQARRHWLRMDCRMCQAQVALALQRFGDKDTPRAIVRSLKERSVSDDELGMFWRDTERSWWWYRAPIESQATMIEAFAEVAQDEAAVEACTVWLLKQKQTQNWKTTKATADAIYALLLRGRNLLASDALVQVALGGETIRPEKVEAGTGFYEQKFVREEIQPSMGEIIVTKIDDGVSWGGVHWQYLEDVAKVTPHADSPLKLTKTLWVKETTNKGQVLKPVSGPLSVGDELVVRIELRTDRDMEYVHLKDQRGSGTEPVNVLSRFRYQDGLGYYESTRDTASHWFIEYLPKGVYVFEYSSRIQLKGDYQSGIAEIQCMYAPEFNSHSGSFILQVK